MQTNTGDLGQDRALLPDHPLSQLLIFAMGKGGAVSYHTTEMRWRQKVKLSGGQSIVEVLAGLYSAFVVCLGGGGGGGRTLRALEVVLLDSLPCAGFNCTVRKCDPITCLSGVPSSPFITVGSGTQHNTEGLEAASGDIVELRNPAYEVDSNVRCSFVSSTQSAVLEEC
jgi:hypothetical protein